MCTKEDYLRILEEEENRKLLESKDIINKFKSIDVIKDYTSIKFEYISSIGLVAMYPNIVKLLNHNIKQDKEGLVSCNLLNKYFKRDMFENGILKSDHYIIMAHPYFRRNYNEKANFSPDFIKLFFGLHDLKIDTYIAIDFNRVRIDLDGGYYMERDRWFGSPFNYNIEKIPDGVVKLKPPEIDKEDGEIIINMLFSDVYSLDIMWYTTKDNIKVFQAEEFKNSNITINIKGIDYYPVRYIHAEYDISNGYFRHFDGAIELYTKEEYELRKDENFNYKTSGKELIKPNSIKLFKMNGEIDIKIWIDFTSHFFSKDPLIIEYFSGEYPKYVVDALKEITKKQ